MAQVFPDVYMHTGRVVLLTVDETHFKSYAMNDFITDTDPHSVFCAAAQISSKHKVRTGEEECWQSS